METTQHTHIIYNSAEYTVSFKSYISNINMNLYDYKIETNLLVIKSI